jgi:hypothetical protein
MYQIIKYTPFPVHPFTPTNWPSYCRSYRSMPEDERKTVDALAHTPLQNPKIDLAAIEFMWRMFGSTGTMTRDTHATGIGDPAACVRGRFFLSFVLGCYHIIVFFFLDLFLGK